ncbi:MAG: Polar-differentiation response regulator DivK [Chlamydiia bacterium]|nr:Polar-differentiation response regulator DivK [Chlamydiia bacterium]MCH9615725.1 Polar-differentiation response regulator DivK [Chlamydiia bacterium]MCH9628872.1 Polar-differentiation response regulator DivK [Chlamydiia bacterium]
MSKILVVEDNPDNAFLAKKILEHFSYEVVLAEDGASAIAKYKEDGIDLVLMDLSLPDMEGVDVTRELISGSEKKVPIIALTAHTGEEVIQKVKDAGCVDFLSKPFEPKQLAEIVRKHLG